MLPKASVPIEMTPFFELTPDLVCIASKEGYFKQVNPAVLACLEYEQAELFSRPIACYIHPEDQELTRRKRIELIEGKPLVNFQNRYVSKTGRVVWLHWTSIYFADQQVVFAIAKDITERKVIEQEVEEKYQQFKELAAHFKESMERDRNMLATELHEQIAQMASVIKMDMDWLMESVGHHEETLRSRIQHAAAVSELMMRTIGKVYFSISPGMLEDIGLPSALRALCREFTLLYSIPCDFKEAFDSSALSYEVKLDVFRICQEVLRGIGGQASRIQVGLTSKATSFELTIHLKDFSFSKETPFDEVTLKDIKGRVTSMGAAFTVTECNTHETRLTIFRER